jgi:multiple sugar transport system ATP-binding protein
MTMGQRISIMKDGLLQQCDVPEMVYKQPANKFVAGFIGSPPMNFVPAKIVGGKVDAGDFSLPLPNAHAALSMEGKDIFLGIRPEAIFDKSLALNVQATTENTFKAKVDVLEPLGPEYVVYLKVGEQNLIATIDNNTKIQEGETYDFVVDLDQIHVFDAETEEAIR